MKPFFRWLIKHRLFVFSGLMFICALVAFRSSNEKSVDFNKLQRKIIELDRNLHNKAKQLLIQKPDFYRPAKTPFFVHFYIDDSLVYWNTNKIPVSKYTSLQFPSDGINRLQNGWYLSAICENESKKVVVSYELRNEYVHENRFLENRSNKSLSQTSFTISLNPNDGFQIKSSKGKYLFSGISPPKTQKENPWILVFLVSGVVFLFFGFYERFKHNNTQTIGFLFFIVVLRLLLFYIDYQTVFQNQSFISAELFGFNQLFPTYFDFCLNLIFGSACFLLIGKLVKNLKIGPYLLIIWFFIGCLLIIEAVKMILSYSSIPLNLLNLFDLNVLSYLSLFVIGIGFFVIYRVFEWVFYNGDKSIFYIYLIVSVAFAFVVFEKSTFISSTFPIIVFFVYHFSIRSINSIISKSILLLIIFSIVLVAEINKHQNLKEQENRILYANQIAAEQDINLELAYLNVKEKLKKDPLIQSVANGQTIGLTLSDFGDILEKKHFQGEWDVYEYNLNLCDSFGRSLFTGDIQFFQTLQNMINKNGTPSAVDPNLFFIRNSTGGYTYILRENILVDNKRFVLLVALKSKRIPEEIGFPRLLISQNARVLNSLEHYSIAKYTDNKLIRSFGLFHFPTSIRAFQTNHKSSSFTDFAGYNHYLLRNQNETVILSIKNYGWVDYVSAFAVTFCFLGLILFIYQILVNRLLLEQNNFSLSLKIQYATVLLIVFVLILFAVGSAYYVQKQFQQSLDDVVEEKLASVEEELNGKISSFKTISIENQGNSFESLLVKLARVFKTDLNIYDKNGFLVASSRNKVFNLGLLSEQINPDAFEKIKRDNRSFFTQKESIGKLNYTSSYQPIYNGEKRLLGYVNLQHFGQQQAFEEQINTFIIAVVNVFILLLLLSIGIALLVSNWVTNPLKILQKRVSDLQITSDIKIAYSGKDEIGTIVSAYNVKLDELQSAAKKLAKSEREAAWRDLAQQVAHEIKNPLTPMKLSIQHSLRIYDPTDEQSTEKVKRVLNSIIEQIDSMTRIANEFSSFAKIPEPIKKDVNLIELIENTFAIFESEEKIKFNLVSSENKLIVNIDREQWVQVFNNLIQNAIHALEAREKGEISVFVIKENDSILIEVSDNGCGISEKEQEKLFVPYFTTKSSGSGIGLSMVKQIIENHDGEISFVSELEKGTTFRIKL